MLRAAPSVAAPICRRDAEPRTQKCQSPPVRVGHEHPAGPGKLVLIWTTAASPNSARFASAFFATGMLVPATDRRGLGAAKERARVRRRCRATESRTKGQATSPLSGQSGAGSWLGPRPTERRTGKSNGLTQRRTGRRTRNSGRPPIRPTMRRTGKSDWPTWRLIGPPAVPPGSSPDERRLPFPPAAATARLHRAGPHLRPLAGLDRPATPARPLRRHAQEGRRAPLAPRPRLRPRHAPARPPRWRRRPHRRSPCCTR